MEGIFVLKMGAFFLPSGNTQNMSDLVAAAEYNRRSVTPGSAQGNDSSFATPSVVTGGGRNSVSPHPQAPTPPPNLNINRPLLKINIPSRGSTTGPMVRFYLSFCQELLLTMYMHRKCSVRAMFVNQSFNGSYPAKYFISNPTKPFS